METKRAPLCICGHAENMHYAASGACMKIITRDSRLENHLRCTCKCFRPDPQNVFGRAQR